MGVGVEMMHLDLESKITDSWDHPWEGFRSSYRGCSQAEAEWVAHCYESEEIEIGWPITGSILWHLNHVGACKAAYTWDLLHPVEVDNKSTWKVIFDIVDLETALNHTNESFVLAAKEFSYNGKIMGKGGHEFSEYIGICLRHEIWHAGQMALIRRLYKRLFA
jgi:hypothetical protein